MYKTVDGSEFIEIIRGLDENLKNIKLSGIEVDRDKFEISYNFLCDVTVDAGLKEKIWAEVEKLTPPIFKSVQVSIKKIITNSELINAEIFKYINDNYPSIAIMLKPTDIITAEVGKLVKYVIRLTKENSEYVVSSGIINKINLYLSKKFCSEFAGSTEIKEAEETVNLLSEEVFASEIQRVEHRTIKVSEVEIIDDVSIGTLALYIEDALSGDVTVCGKITDIAEKETKTGKPFFIIHLDDTTGRTSGVYFSKKNTLEKVRKLQVGDAIIVHGNIGEYNGRPSFTFDRLNKCVFPSDFVKKDRFKKSAPSEYKLIYPEKASTIKIESVFDENSELPNSLLENEYVVFDLETTGLDVMNNGIIEIGAVKIKEGKIAEQWTTLVKPDYPITGEIFKLTGISEDMVKDAPKISAVIPDFMKFINGSILVAHNAEFDSKFIKRFAGGEEYEIKNKIMDTMEMVRECVPSLKRSDLHTMAEHFGVVFHHHRALSDAYATAECFVELMKIKG